MADYWETYEKLLRNGIDSAAMKDLAAQDALNNFWDGIINDPAYQENALLNGKETPLVISRTSTLKCSLKASPDTDIHIGDMITCFNEEWIVVELYHDKIGLINGEIWLCNNSVNFQNQTAEIHSRYCVIDDGSYSKLSSNSEAVIMANTYKIYMSIDKETRRMYVDKRLGFGSIFNQNGNEILEVYKIIGMDMKSKNFGDGSHLMVITAQRDVYNPATDSIGDNLCDVFKGSNIESTPSDNGKCFVDGADSIRIGTQRQYCAVFVDSEGNTVDGAKALWTISLPDGVTTKTSEENPNAFVVSAPLDYNLVGQEISIKVTDENSQYGTFEKKVRVITIG